MTWVFTWRGRLTPAGLEVRAAACLVDDATVSPFPGQDSTPFPVRDPLVRVKGDQIVTIDFPQKTGPASSHDRSLADSTAFHHLDHLRQEGPFIHRRPGATDFSRSGSEVSRVPTVRAGGLPSKARRLLDRLSRCHRVELNRSPPVPRAILHKLKSRERPRPAPAPQNIPSSSGRFAYCNGRGLREPTVLPGSSAATPAVNPPGLSSGHHSPRWRWSTPSGPS